LEVLVDLFSTMRVFRRHWKLLAPLVLLAVLAEFVLPNRVPPSYRTTTRILLLPMAADVSPTGGYNPFLNFSQSLITFAGVVAQSASTPEAVQRMKGEGARVPFKVSPPAIDWNPGPIIGITVEDTDPEAVRATTAVVVADLLRTLQTQQKHAGVPTSTLVKGSVISQDTQPVAVYSKRQRAQLAIGVLAVALIAGAAFLIEAFGGRRQRQAVRPVTPATFRRPLDADVVARYNGGAQSR
jgi:capsular polysaccharide biosynthesis protein